jgi:DNA-binding transcriptional ArsR family regulator
MEITTPPQLLASEQEKQAVRALGALAQALRLRVFRALVQAGPNGLTPTLLQASTGAAAATLSFHLKELTQAQLVDQQREGRNLVYRARFDQMAALMAYLTEHCCGGADCGLPGSASLACC